MVGHGYVFDIAYKATFNSGSLPGAILTELQANGRVGFDLGRRFRMVDFGCGRGMTLTVLAAAYPKARFIGVDLNRDHIAEARSRAKRLGLANLSFLHGHFADHGTSQADIAIAQGIYSWVSAEDRADLLNCLARVLGPGGVVQMSYNLEPGFAQLRPVREAWRTLCRATDLPPDRARLWAVEKLAQLCADKVPFFAEHPMARQEVGQWGADQLGYLAHEFLNENWHLSSFSQVTDQMTAQDLQFAGTPLSWRDEGEHLAGVPDGAVPLADREDLSAFALNIPFRNDLFARDGAACGPVIPEDAMFGPACPARWPAVQSYLAGADLGARLAARCFQVPQTWGTLQRHFSDAEARDLAAALVGAMQKRLLARYASGWRGQGGQTGDLAFASPLSHEIVTDPELAQQFHYFPSRAFGGAVAVPPAVSQSVAALIAHGPSVKAQAALRARATDILGVATPTDGQARQMLDEARSIWVPHLLAAGVLAVAGNG